MSKNGCRMFEIMNECDRLDLTTIKEWLSGLDCKYLIVKHDKDLPRAPHYHVFIKLANDRTFKDVAKQCNVQVQYVERVKGWKNALAYAFHLTEGAKDDGKYQYDESAVISSQNVDVSGIFKTAKEYDDEREHEKALKEIFYAYGNCDISKYELMKRISPKDYHKYSSLFRDMANYRVMKVRERNMNVIYITGVSGSGKTTLAKYMARICNYDFFVSGSGKDVLDGYDKEECIILDDLRADVFTKAELFKLTDNNTNSSVKSRFKNKDISYCKLMIITSIKNPRDLYNWDEVLDKDETFSQFARRLNNKFLYIDRDGFIIECNYDLDLIHTVKKVQDFKMDDVFALLGIEKRIGTSIMDEIFRKVKTDVDNAKKKYENDDDLPF